MFILLIVKKGDMFIHVEFQYYKASKPYQMVNFMDFMVNNGIHPRNLT